MKTNETNQLSPAEFAAILSTTLAMAEEAGLFVGVQNRPASGVRPGGLLIFIGGLSATEDGRLVATENELETEDAVVG